MTIDPSTLPTSEHFYFERCNVQSDRRYDLEPSTDFRVLEFTDQERIAISIEKFGLIKQFVEQHRTVPGWHGVLSCPLCVAYLLHGGDCFDCPICLQTGHTGCSGTPYDEICGLREEPDEEGYQRALQLLDEEIALLKSLPEYSHA